MTTFIFGDYLYENPIFMVKALTRTEIPEAFNQLEKLRRSGYLAGFMRWDTVSPAPEESVQPDPRFEPAPYINFVLYRRRRRLPSPTLGPQIFCPSIKKGLDADLFLSMRERLLEKDPVADAVLSEEVVLDTQCDGRRLFDLLGRGECRAYFKDAFEELLFLAPRPFLQLTRQSSSSPECLQVLADTPADRVMLTQAASAHAEPGTVSVSAQKIEAVVKSGETVQNLLTAFFPDPAVRGAGTDPEQLFALEQRRRGAYGGLVGVFTAEETCLATTVRTLERRPGEKVFRLGLGQRVTASTDPNGAFANMQSELQKFILPPEFSLSVAVRVCDGKAFLLRDQLSLLTSEAKEHCLPAEEVHDLLSALGPDVTPAGSWACPGDPGPLAPAFLADMWQELPPSLKAACRHELEAGGLFRLVLNLSQRGLLAVPEPVTSTDTRRLVISRAALDERNDFLYLPCTTRPWFDDAARQIAAGECFDYLFVNRLGAVCTGSRGSLVFEVGGKYITPPVPAGRCAGTLRAILLARGILLERTLSLSSALSANRVFCLNSVTGATEVQLENPRLAGRS